MKMWLGEHQEVVGIAFGPPKWIRIMEPLHGEGFAISGQRQGERRWPPTLARCPQIERVDTTVSLVQLPLLLGLQEGATALKPRSPGWAARDIVEGDVVRFEQISEILTSMERQQDVSLLPITTVRLKIE